MAKINLLPWRDELRAQKRLDFIKAIGAGVFCTGIIFAGVHMYIEGLKAYQEQRNKMIQDEIALLDKKIEQIKTIEDQKNKLLTKIEVIQKLQESRPEIVHLFDELPRVTPDGVVLSTFTQKGSDLTFEGKSQSNARVSALMRAIEASNWLKQPTLDVIQTGSKDSSDHSSTFTLRAKQNNKDSSSENDADNATGKRSKRSAGGK